MRYLRENWPWIVLPALLALAAVAALVWFGGEGEAGPFVYDP